MLPVPSLLKNEVWVILRPQLLVLKMLSLWEKGSRASETSLCADVSLQGHEGIGVWMVLGVSECLGWDSGGERLEPVDGFSPVPLLVGLRQGTPST